MAETGSLGEQSNRIRQLRILIASFAAYCIANIAGWIVPDLVNEFIAVHHLSESRAGLVGTVELGMLAIASIALARFVGRISFLKISLIGTLIAIVATFLSTMAQRQNLLLLLRAITGLGEGATLMVASAALASFRDPDRAYGQMNVVNILFGTALIQSLPMLASHVGPNVAFPALLLGLLLLAPFLLFMPKDLALDRPVLDKPVVGEMERAAIPGRLYLLAAIMFLIALNSSAVWSFLVLLGTRAGLGQDAALRLVATVAFVSITGSGLATVLGTRFGRLVPITIGVMTMTGCIAMLCLSTDQTLFKICACLMVTAVYFIIPYFMGYAAAGDEAGRGAALVGGSFLLTVAVAPYTGGLLIENFGIASMAAMAIVTNIVGVMGLIWFDRDMKRHLADRARVDSFMAPPA